MNLRKTLLRTCVAVTTLTWAAAAIAQTRTFDVPSDVATNSIPEFARQAGIQIVAPADSLEGVRTPAIKGTIDLHAALAELLKGTDVQVASDDGQVITLKAPSKKTSVAGDPPADPPADIEGSAIETVTVTAEKKSEKALNVPMGLTALSGEALQRSQSYRLEDYAGKVPGLTFLDNGQNGSELVIRGMSVGVLPINSPVATYIDETPYTTAGAFAGSFFIAPNLDTFDMQRIEVLRGPQGTLYGANALAGLLKYVTNAPDPSGFSAEAEAGASSVAHGANGFDLHAMVNVPLADDAALRVVGYDNYYPGFINDPSRGLKGINGSHFSGGRASLLYNPTDTLSVRLTAIYQDKVWGDNNNMDVEPGTLKPAFGNLVQENLISQPGHTTTELYNLTVTWDTDIGKLLSSSSYFKAGEFVQQDGSKNLGGILSGILGSPYGLGDITTVNVKSETQELRLSSKENSPLEWQIGALYSHRNSLENEPLYPIDISTKTLLTNFPTNVGAFLLKGSFDEWAAFANADYFISPAFDVSFGGRYDSNDQKYFQDFTGIFGGNIAFGNPSSEGVFTYSTDARWHITPNQMLYARVASGFAPGGPNDATLLSNLQHSYQSSTTVNYEAGLKGSYLDNHLTLELSAFDIEWSRIQLNAIINSFGTVTNGGNARSTGAEWNVAFVPLTGLTLDFNGAYTDAYLTTDAPASVGGHAGERLPATPLWESSASADYEHPLFDDYSGFVGFNWRFSGSRYAEFEPASPRQEMPSFNLVDARIGIEKSNWSLTFYCKNIANALAINYVEDETLLSGNGLQSAAVYPPRTFGVELTSNF